MRKTKDTLICSCIALVIGAVMGVISGLFGIALNFVTEIHRENYLYLTPFLGAAGISIVFLYRKFSPRSQQGLDLAIAYQMGEVNEKGEIKDFGRARKIGKFPNAYVVLKLAANIIMLSFGASTGKEGTVAQCGAAVGDYASRIFRSRKYSQILMLAGVSAALGGLFGTPLGGMFFSLEFAATGILFYEALVPAFISAYTACMVAGFCGYEPFCYSVDASLSITPQNVLLIIAAAAAFGIIGRLFAIALKKSREIYKERVTNPYLGIFAAGCIMAGFLMFIHGGRYCGTGEQLIEGIFEHGSFYIYDFALKFIFTVICICVGYSGGEMTPLIAIGATAGAAFSQITGMPIGLCTAMGCVAVYGSATNTLLAPIFIGIELFGGDGAVFYAVACAIAFAVNGNNSIYSSQRHVIRSMYSVLKK